MSSLSLLWLKFGRTEGQTGTLPDLQAYYGSVWPSISGYFLPTQQLALSVGCPKPGGPGCPRKVVIHGHDDIVAVCGNAPKQCDPITLHRQDIIIHELRLDLVLGDLARFLHVKGGDPQNILPLTWNLGVYAAPERSPMTVFVSLQSDSDGMQSVIIQLLAQKEKPFILLAPSWDICPVSMLKTIQNAEFHFIGLDDLQLDPRRMDTEGFENESILGKHLGVESETDNYFRLEKDYWKIRFCGKNWSLKQSVGMQYIAHLIQRSYNDEPPIHVKELFYLVSGKPPTEYTKLNEMTKKELEKIGLDVKNLGDAGDLMTPEGKKWARTQLYELNKSIAEAENEGQVGEILRLREVKEDLEDYVNKAYGLRGRTRKASDSDERIRKTVTQEIIRTLNRIGKKDGDELAMYLDNHLKRGIFCSFQKDPKIDWKISM